MFKIFSNRSASDNGAMENSDKGIEREESSNPDDDPSAEFVEKNDNSFDEKKHVSVEDERNEKIVIEPETGSSENFPYLNAVLETLNDICMNQNKLMKGQKVLDDNIRMLHESSMTVIEKQEDTIQKQHNAALKFQEDVLFKIQKNLIMELIGIADNIQMMIENKESNPDYDLLEAIKDLSRWVDASLCSNSVKKFADAGQDNTVFNRKRQELVEKETTDNPGEHNTYKTLRCGYEWTLPYLVVNSDVQLQRILDENRSPKMFSFVIRPEEIVKLIYRKENETKE